MSAGRPVLKTRLMRVEVQISEPRQPAYLKLTHSLNTIWEDESCEIWGAKMNESDEENTLFSRMRMDLLFTKRQKNELRIASDGIAYPYHEFMKHYGVPRGNYYWKISQLFNEEAPEHPKMK